MRSPWLLGDVPWDDVLIRRAVIWLSLVAGTAILRLTDSHYADNHLQVCPPADRLGHWTLPSVACAALTLSTATGAARCSRPEAYTEECNAGITLWGVYHVCGVPWVLPA